MIAQTPSIPQDLNLEGRVILQILPALESGGVERGTIEIARAITQAGGRAVVASAGGGLMNRLMQAGAEHVTLPLKRRDPLTIFQNVNRLVQVIEKHGVDLVHVRSRAPAWSAFYAAQRTGRPLVTTFHGTYGLKGPFKKQYNAIMTRGDRVIAISDFIAHHIRHIYGIDEQKMHVVPRGVDLDSFDPAKVNGQRMINLIRRWRVPEHRPIIMLPGRLTRWKGQMVFLEAAARLEQLDASWVLVGDDSGRPAFRKELEKRIDELGIEGRVFITGNCEDMAAAYMVSAAVVSASIEPEAFGRVAVEAQAMGRPMIATDLGGSRETVLNRETGWLVPPNDPEALAQALLQAFSLDQPTLDLLAHQAREHVAESFDIALMCNRTLAIYLETLTGG